MSSKWKTLWIVLLISGLFTACGPSAIEADVLITGGTVIDGSGKAPIMADVALAGDTILFVGDASGANIKAAMVVNATGKIVSAGFIDAHTHSLGDLKSSDRNANLNYLTQGVTTVLNGNDGDGPFNIDALSTQLESQGIGTNTAFLVGHNMVRKAVLGDKNVAPDAEQLNEMKALVRQGMEEGAFGFSTGLYYAPGSYSDTKEVIELTKEVAPFGGLYDSHIRDESSYTIGLINAVKETLEIGEKAGVPVHFAHIKALGVDVWNKSDEVIELIEAAQARGMTVTADQYPWRASGTHLENALIDRWVMAGGDEEYYKRLNNPQLLPRIKQEIAENMRKRGGADALLITADVRDTSFIGFNLAQLSERLNMPPVEVALKIARDGGARVASFNMNPYDLENFVTRPWVMTGSDGTTGHPRKYASYPKKYRDYVVKKQLLSIESFVFKSSGQVAQTFGLERRGALKPGYFADVIIFNPDEFKPMADFSNPDELSVGIEYLWVNGRLTLENGTYTKALNGRVLKKHK
ncbi:MAG: amidohydrolase family protein [Roseivirga sp.]|nr:amidohydrolase family protein [Roseivirga sp.]